MKKNYKAIIIVTSLSGKTTLIKYLRRISVFPLLEIDDELSRLNGGVFPKDDNYKNTKLATQIKKEVLDTDNFIFFTNAHYFSQNELEIAGNRGFKIIQIFVTREELEKRNKMRMQKEGYDDHSQWLDSMLQYQKEMYDKGLVDTVIETNKPTEEIAKELITLLQK